jgi:hypothetical protein
MDTVLTTNQHAIGQCAAQRGATPQSRGASAKGDES